MTHVRMFLRRKGVEKFSLLNFVAIITFNNTTSLLRKYVMTSSVVYSKTEEMQNEPITITMKRRKKEIRTRAGGGGGRNAWQQPIAKDR